MSGSALAYFLGARRDVVYLDLVEISHPAFSQTYYRVRNHRQGGGVWVVLEDGSPQWFDWYPMQITEMGDSADLDTGLQIDFGDLGQILPKELDRVRKADAMGTKPSIVFRAYRSDDLGLPLVGPMTLEGTTFSFTREGASFEATAPYVNNTGTGETYTGDRFIGLRAYNR